MTTTTAPDLTTINGGNLRTGDRVIHPRTGRTVELLDELGRERDDLRRFLVQGQRGGYDSLTIAETSAVVAVGWVATW